MSPLRRRKLLVVLLVLTTTAAAASPVTVNDDTSVAAAIQTLPEATVRALLHDASQRDNGAIESAVLSRWKEAQAALTVTKLSRSRVPLDDGTDCSDSAVGRRMTVEGAGFRASGAAVCNVTSASVLEGFVVGFLPPRQTKAVVINATHLSCCLPPVETAGPAHVMVSMDGRTWSAKTDAALVEYFPLGSLAVGRRPYTTETDGSVIVRLAPELLAIGRVTASVILQSSPPVALVAAAQLFSQSNVLSFPLSGLPVSLDSTIRLTLRAPSSAGVVVLNKTRFFARHTPNADQPHAVVVDHHTRSLRVDGTAWQGTGWWIFSGLQCNGSSIAPPWDWAPGDGPHSLLGQINQLSAAGFNQFVIYDLDKIVCGQAVNQTLVPILDSIAAVGAKVLLDIRSEVIAVMNDNTTDTHWEYLREIVDAVKQHQALLAYLLRPISHCTE